MSCKTRSFLLFSRQTVSDLCALYGRAGWHVKRYSNCNLLWLPKFLGGATYDASVSGRWIHAEIDSL